MPYSKAGRRAATAGKPNYRKRAPKKGTVSKAVKQYVRKAMPKTEMKSVWNHDNEVLINTLNQGVIVGLPQITQGTSSTTRIGNEIYAKMLHMKGVLYNNSASESYIRLIVCGHDANINPTIGTFPLFVNGSSGNTVTASSVNGLDAQYFPLNKKDLTIYVDRKFKLAGSNVEAGARNTRMFSECVKWPGMGKRVIYEGNTAGYEAQNWLCSVIWVASDANDDTTTGTNVELSQLTRFYFRDP